MLDAKSWDVAENLFDMETDIGTELFYSLEEDDIIMIMEYMKWRSKAEAINQGIQIWDKPVSAKLREMASDWEFAGVCDYGYFGAETCVEGHPIRYAYNVHSPSVGITVPFGVKCVSDFFDVPQVKMNAYKKFFKLAQNELLRCLNEGRYINNDTEFLNNMDFILGLKDKSFETFAKRQLGAKGVELALSFVYRGFHLPLYLKQEILRIKRKYMQNMKIRMSDTEYSHEFSVGKVNRYIFDLIRMTNLHPTGSNVAPLSTALKLERLYTQVSKLDIEFLSNDVKSKFNIISFSELLFRLQNGTFSVESLNTKKSIIYLGFALDDYKVWYSFLGVSDMKDVIEIMCDSILEVI